MKRLFAMCAAVAIMSGCGTNEPFTYVKVAGDVSYDDNSAIPMDGAVLTFYPQGGSLNEKTNPRPGKAMIDGVTGKFHAVTSHTFNDGLPRGKYRVTLLGPAYAPLPTSIVPLDYSDPFKTPLEVDTAHTPFHLKVKKP